MQLCSPDWSFTGPTEARQADCGGEWQRKGRQTNKRASVRGGGGWAAGGEEAARSGLAPKRSLVIMPALTFPDYTQAGIPATVPCPEGMKNRPLGAFYNKARQRRPPLTGAHTHAHLPINTLLKPFSSLLQCRHLCWSSTEAAKACLGGVDWTSLPGIPQAGCEGGKSPRSVVKRPAGSDSPLLPATGEHQPKRRKSYSWNISSLTTNHVNWSNSQINVWLLLRSGFEIQCVNSKVLPGQLSKSSTLTP